MSDEGNVIFPSEWHETAALLDEREKTHGPYPVKCRIIQSLKDTMHKERGWDNLSDVQRESLDMIVHKIGRVLSGDADYPDHWNDIAGYAKLVTKWLTQNE